MFFWQVNFFNNFCTGVCFFLTIFVRFPYKSIGKTNSTSCFSADKNNCINFGRWSLKNSAWNDHPRIIPVKNSEIPSCSLGDDQSKLLTEGRWTTTDEGHQRITKIHLELMAHVS